jgi:molybdopterin converting factor small subunit
MNMTVEIIGVGIFRQIMKKAKLPLEIETGSESALPVHMVLETLDALYDGQFAKELYLKEGKPNLWTRVMLNGRDIRFLDEAKLFVHDGDTLLISSVMGGG